MKFIPLIKRYPNPEQIILIKLKPDKYNELTYYVVKYTNSYQIHNSFRFQEAGGEEYSYWDEDEILGWMPLEELDTIPVDGKESI